ncbi:NAD(P)/FAD-dependent oxidoreductase [Bradyrhizobium vignae]|uniref:NAD(P)/FAD-dependent oxidoreductase n=1 Tax=Bradyrhizobium vignae TaxID=1549949 RepID=UPI00100BA003|nr:FAD/NAD(P)-binding oxidoreductase [Bradyrhizobium vignae]RXG97180.1 hypothetical protein EAV90_22690 [Bradyrhizobium vignae]
MQIPQSLSQHVYEACKVADTLFVLNPFLPQQNFYSQQLRALALAAEITDRHMAPGRRKVCVVGAGVSGRMVAAALCVQKVGVILVDKSQIEFSNYLNATHRELHPNIIFWPFQRPKPATDLPFLNWGQASVPEVVEALKSEWKETFARKIETVPAEVISIDRAVSPLQINLDNGGSLSADLCILATGFAAEVQFGDIKTPGYWSPGAIADQEAQIMVSGSGDGGLIDALSPILGKDVTRAAHIVATRLADKPIVEDIRAVESARRNGVLAGSKDSSDPCHFYSTVTLEPEDAAAFANMIKRKPAPHVTLLHESTTAYSFAAAPINKLLLAHFSNGTARCVSHVKGKLSRSTNGTEMIPDDGTPEQIHPPGRFDRIVVRHGAVPAALKLLTPEEGAHLKELAGQFADAAELPGYDEKRYAWKDRKIGSAGIGMKPLADSVRKALDQVSRAYGFRVSNVEIRPECFYGSAPITVTLPVSDKEKAEQAGIFPLRIGPATVDIADVAPSRGIDD